MRFERFCNGFRSERGQALPLFALGLLVTFGAVGMAIDAGRVVGTRAELQKAADAAALAGSQDLPNPSAATTTAGYYLDLNASGLAERSFSIRSQSAANDTILVTARKRVDYTFIRLLGASGTTVAATATAKMTRGAVTGYTVGSVAPFSIWGGSRAREVNPGDAAQSCRPLHLCVGKSYTFLDDQWMSANGNPTAPDWVASDSNNFKGDLEHGDPAELKQIGDTWVTHSLGGVGSVEVPTVGSLIVIPVFSRAVSNANDRTFTIAAWAIVKVDAGCRKQHCSGTLQETTTTPPPGWSIGGPESPPSTLTYTAVQLGLTQ